MIRLVAFALLAITPNCLACSAILLGGADHPVVARNYDWHLGHALVMVNQREIAKRALSLDNPAEWTSNYGSVTINQYGRELPCEGMNEAGLAIVILWLHESEYPRADSRPSVTSAQWLQYQLDTASSVSDVIASEKQIRITPLGGAKVHYFVADATGDCAVIEYVNGKQVVHHGADLPQCVVTNNTYADSNRFLRQHQDFGGQQPTPTGGDSLSRFARLSTLVRQPQRDESPQNAALHIIDSAASRERTRWQAAYDLRERRFSFRTRDHRPLRELNLAQLDFTTDRPVQVLNIEARLAGDVSGDLRDYSPSDNRRLVERSFAHSEFVRGLPAGLMEMVIDYPEVSCRPLAPEPATR